MPVLITILCLIILVLIIGLIFLFNKYKNLIEEHQKTREEIIKLESKSLFGEMENIKYKMNPHLFKNILNSIQSHAYQTYYSLDKLSNVLDYILYESDRKLVSVKEELEFALSLIEINKLKLSPLFDIQIKNKISDSDPFYQQEVMCPLVTVDLIENAFKHTDIKSENSFISITFELNNGIFILSVANKISSQPPIKKSKSGIGQEHAIKRLDLIYKDCYHLEQTKENMIFISHLKINLLEYKNKMLASGR